MSVVVLGASGMLGQRVVKQLGDVKTPDINICNYQQVKDYFSSERPEVVVNCAAYTSVDQAEEEPDNCFQVNFLGVRNIAKCFSGRQLVHVSTDYVFGSGNFSEPITEEENPSPLGVYGWSKLAGEEVLGENSTILRTSWLHGPGGKNFPETILRAARQQKTLKVVNDQFGCPTFTGWLAKVISVVIEKRAFGTFHASSKGVISWYDFAAYIVKSAGLDTEVLPQTTAESGRKAKRPPYSALDTNKLSGLVDIPDWKEGVEEHLSEL